MRRLWEKRVAQQAEWEERSLAGRDLVYVWADGIYAEAGIEKEKVALLALIGAIADGTKEALTATSGYRESAESWSAVLRDGGESSPLAPRCPALQH